MRIRTIKPEFWQNRELATTSPFSRLLAIALLNWADDDGWFKADLALIRGSLFPFDEDSTNVPRAIAELSRIGFIQVADHAGIPLGMVVNFRKHQRIDRPQRSRLAIPGLFAEDSTNVPRAFAAGMEQGTGKGIREGEGKAPPPQIPDPVDSDSSDPPDLIAFIAAAEHHAKGNADGFVIPPAFVRHWHNIRLSKGWEDATGRPVPMTIEARVADLKVFARRAKHSGELAAFMAPEKKEVPGGITEPEGDWRRFCREGLGFEPPGKWSDLPQRLKQEVAAAWQSERNKEVPEHE